MVHREQRIDASCARIDHFFPFPLAASSLFFLSFGSSGGGGGGGSGVNVTRWSSQCVTAFGGIFPGTPSSPYLGEEGKARQQEKYDHPRRAKERKKRKDERKKERKKEMCWFMWGGWRRTRAQQETFLDCLLNISISLTRPRGSCARGLSPRRTWSSQRLPSPGSPRSCPT